MFMYKHGAIRDSVKVVLNITKIKDVPAWNWKTEYLSDKMPMTKDYILRLKDASKQWYITDEGGGVELNDYLFGNKLYTVFETEGVILTSSYELINDKLVFEVTSGKKIVGTNNGITNYSVENLQRVELRRGQQESRKDRKTGSQEENTSKVVRQQGSQEGELQLIYVSTNPEGVEQ